MRTIAEKRLVVLMVAVSLTLTAVTVWAVAQQGAALRSRELTDLRGAAIAAAAEREAGQIFQRRSE